MEATKLFAVVFKLCQEVAPTRGCASWFGFRRKDSLEGPDLEKSFALVVKIVLLHDALGCVCTKTLFSQQITGVIVGVRLVFVKGMHFRKNVHVHM